MFTPQGSHSFHCTYIRHTRVSRVQEAKQNNTDMYEQFCEMRILCYEKIPESGGVINVGHVC